MQGVRNAQTTLLGLKSNSHHASSISILLQTVTGITIDLEHYTQNSSFIYSMQPRGMVEDDEGVATV